MENYLLETIRNRYPNENTNSLALDLNLSIYQLRRIVSKYEIKKSDSFKKELICSLHQNKHIKYQNSIQPLRPSSIQENIIIGSLLGDGNLARYGRSKESHYREHGCISQANYRKWKFVMLQSLSFKYFPNSQYPCITSSSNPLFSKYHNDFYSNKRKQITNEILNRLNHPLGLLCLYLDDGTLVIDRYIRKKNIHLFPRITLYTQSFTKEENILLLNHIKNTFNIQFILKKRKDGNGFVLQYNYRDEIIKFLKLIQLDEPLLECMKYKMDLEFVMKQNLAHYKIKYPSYNIIIDRFE